MKQLSEQSHKWVLLCLKVIVYLLNSVIDKLSSDKVKQKELSNYFESEGKIKNESIEFINQLNLKQ